MAPKKNNNNSQWHKVKKVMGRFPLKDLVVYKPETLKKIKNKSGKNLIHWSSKHNKFKITQYLIDIGCDVNHKDEKYNLTPLGLALNKGSSRMVRLLLNAGAPVSWNSVKGKSGDLEIRGTDSAETLRLFLRHSTPSPKEQNTEATVKRLLEVENWPLDAIASLQSQKFIKSALKLKNLESDYENLMKAVKTDDVLEVKKLVESVAQSKKLTSSILIEAAKYNTKKSTIILKLLIDKGAPLNGFIDHAKLPLKEAMLRYHVHNAWILLDHGAEFGTFRIHEIFNHQKKKNSYISHCWRMVMNHDKIFDKSSLQNNDYLESLLDKFFLSHHRLANCENENLPYRLYYTAPIIEWLAKLVHLGVDKDHITNFFLKKYFDNFDFFDDSDDDDPQQNQLEFRYKRLFNHYFNDCNTEILRMMECQISEDLTVWDILVQSIDQIIPYTRNKILMEKMLSMCSSGRFSFYRKSLQFKIDKALEKRLLIDKSVKVLTTCLPLVGNYSQMMEKIVEYLGVPNLLVLKY